MRRSITPQSASSKLLGQRLFDTIVDVTVGGAQLAMLQGLVPTLRTVADWPCRSRGFFGALVLARLALQALLGSTSAPLALWCIFIDPTLSGAVLTFPYWYRL